MGGEGKGRGKGEGEKGGEGWCFWGICMVLVLRNFWWERGGGEGEFVQGKGREELERLVRALPVSVVRGMEGGEKGKGMNDIVDSFYNDHQGLF